LFASVEDEDRADIAVVSQAINQALAYFAQGNDLAGSDWKPFLTASAAVAWKRGCSEPQSKFLLKFADMFTIKEVGLGPNLPCGWQNIFLDFRLRRRRDGTTDPREETNPAEATNISRATNTPGATNLLNATMRGGPGLAFETWVRVKHKSQLSKRDPGPLMATQTASREKSDMMAFPQKIKRSPG
jgi:hypothetical protein